MTAVGRVPEPCPFHESRQQRLPCDQPGCSWGAPGPDVHVQTARRLSIGDDGAVVSTPSRLRTYTRGLVAVGDRVEYLWVEVGDLSADLAPHLRALASAGDELRALGIALEAPAG